jgi:hypothetical protein
LEPAADKPSRARRFGFRLVAYVEFVGLVEDRLIHELRS